ncbi:MAG: carboxypeptidase regulatory-like domain-containing protein [Acidobacteriota bacterium]
MSQQGSRLLVLCLLAVTLHGQTTPGFPIQRVVLYKNGVGYFEHAGKVSGSQDVRIGFTTGQLNDVLKSLTVLDLGGGRVTGVNYSSEGPLDRRLSELRLPVGQSTTLTEFLGGLRGAHLEVRSGASSATGRLLSIERKTRMGGGATLEVDYMSLLTESGEVKTVELSSGYSVKLTEPGLAGKLDRYLNLLSGEREPDLRQMVVSTSGTGERDLFVSYISEVPVWKTTYRLVLNAAKDAKPLLQGWAIIDNTVGEDWKNVQLSLVAGAPQSFIQRLSQPYFARRPEVGLPEAYNPSPQTYQATLMLGNAQLAGTVRDQSGATIAGAQVRALTASGEQLAAATTDANGNYSFNGLPEGDVRIEVSQRGFKTKLMTGLQVHNGRPMNNTIQLDVGAVAETVEVRATASTMQTETAMISGSYSRSAGNNSALGRNNTLGGSGRGSGVGSGMGGGVGTGSGGGFYAASAGLTPQANAQELGDLFEYKLKTPVTIAKNQSALVPIVNASVEAEKVSIWSSSIGGPRARRGVWLNNTSGATLDGGSFTVIDDDAFAGEGLLDPIRPAERRLIAYATDLALNASSRQESQQQRIARVLLKKGVLTFQSEVRESTIYTFRNEDTHSRMVIVEHPVRTTYKQRGGPEPVETTTQFKRYRLEVPVKQTAALTIEEARPLSSTLAISKLDSKQLALYVKDGTIIPAMEQSLRRILAARDVVNGLKTQNSLREQERDAIFDDQQRLRENIKSLKGSPEEKPLLQRYTQRLNQQEDRLEALRKEMEDLEKKIEAAEEVEDRLTDEAVFDVPLTQA